MPDRKPDAPGPPPFSLVKSGPVDTQAAQRVDPCRVAGEDAPVWLAAGFAIIGTMIAVASASAWQQTAVGSIQPPPPPTASLVAEPPRQNQDELSASPPPPVREAPIQPPPQPTPEIPPPPSAAASVAAPPVISTAAPTAATISTEKLPDRRTTTVECFGPITISFAHNSARPNRDDVRKSVEPLRQWLLTQSDATVLIEGHSDTTGTEDYNVLLSYSRAKAVASQLKTEGIPIRQMTIRAAGSSDAAGGANDRSALLRIAGVEDCGGVETATKGQ